MTIATKNNAIIVKDGKLAENCGCCGGWYCYNNCADFLCVDAPTASVTLAATDFLANAIYRYAPENRFTGLPTYWEKETKYFKGSEINGTHVLQRRNDLSSSTTGVWDSSATFWASCPVGGALQIVRRQIRLTLSTAFQRNWVLSVPIVSYAWYTDDRLSSAPTPTGFRTAGDFSCDSLCNRCFTENRQTDLYAACNLQTGVISMNELGRDPVSSFPVQFAVGFRAQGWSSDYFRQLEYASGPLFTSWSVTSVSIG
jgi:hypothetical protein